MKRLLSILIVVFAFNVVFADGWREGEKQIKITVENQQQFEQLASLRLSMDVHGPDFENITAYVIPKELEQIELFGLNYEIEIEDLNKYNLDFWLTEDSYHTYAEIIELADSLEEHFPDICKRYLFGMDETGQYELTALKISDNVEVDEPEAEVMFDGGIHGDEVGGAENVIRFARDICIDYGDDPDITFLIDNREIWLYLMVNPYGRVGDIRYNANGVDLNRDWCYMWDAWGGSPGPCSQVESKALRECMYNNQFVVHTSYHSGTEYISCPWSYRSSTPHDMNHILQLAGVYADVSGYGNMPYGQGNSGMYPINGSTKDSNYGIMGSIAWSMEISNSKHPPASQIMMYYNYNKPSMIAMIEYAGYGLEGTITNANTGDPVAAIVFVNDYHATYSDPTAGDYHKYVLEGTYSITVMANGYATQTIDNIAVSEFNSTVTNFQLTPEDGQYAYKFSSSQIPDNNEADEGWTAGALGAPDMVNYSIGKNGWVVLDMQYPVIDGPGPDFIVHEGDATAEDYTCYVGETLDGPWFNVGMGSGTFDFDIASAGIPEAQFIKLVDDGDGQANVGNAGFDLDAIEALEPVSGVYLAMYEYMVDDSNGNNNGKIDPGETVDIIVTLKNNGDLLAENIEGEITTTSSYLNLVSNTASFGSLSLGQTGSGTFTVFSQANTPTGEPAEIDLDISANSGAYTNNFMMNFVIGQIPVVIIDMDENHNSASVIKSAIEDNGIAVESLTSFPGNVDIYSTIFVCLGVYNDNHTLSSSEGQTLADFLNNGGNLYMEGGDTWYYDNQTAVHSMFNILGTSDGSEDLGTINGQSGTFTEEMNFSYSGDNSWIDHIDPISPAFTIFENQSPNYGTGVAHDAGSYKTIGASHEFGGLTDGSSPSTKEELMAEYLLFFGIGSSLQASFISSATEICTDGQIEFSDISTGDVVSWEWEFEMGIPATSIEQNPMVVYFYQGAYDVSLTVSDGTNTSTLSLDGYIDVNAVPTIPAKPEGPEVAGSYPGWTNDYVVMEVLNTDSYIWQLDPAEAGSVTENGNECTIDWTDYWEGNANLSVTAVNVCGESGYSEPLQIIVTLTDINEYINNGISIFPNPNNGEFEIHLGDLELTNPNIKILNNLGKVVYESEDLLTGEKNLNVDLSNLDSGIYFIIIKSGKKTYNERIIIK